MLILIHALTIGVINTEQWGNIQDVKVLAIMAELVIIQKLSMDLLLVVNLVVYGYTKELIILLSGAYNYFRDLEMASSLQDLLQEINYMAQRYTR